MLIYKIKIGLVAIGLVSHFFYSRAFLYIFFLTNFNNTKKVVKGKIRSENVLLKLWKN